MGRDRKFKALTCNWHLGLRKGKVLVFLGFVKLVYQGFVYIFGMTTIFILDGVDIDTYILF